MRCLPSFARIMGSNRREKVSRFVVQYSPRSKRDLQESYDWGVDNWGREDADNWIRQMEELIAKRLSLVPLACPLAPENPDFEFELRHLVTHRYRVLFTISENNVFVLRIRGPFTGGGLELE